MLAELDGAPPADLATETAMVLESAGRRALAREANASARKLLLRSVELEPTLERRYNAARAAWKLSDLPSTYTEMEDVCAAAAEAGNPRIETWALIALAESTLFRNADVDNAHLLAERAIAIVPEDDGEARFALLELHSVVAKWRGDMDEAERYLARRRRGGAGGRPCRPREQGRDGAGPDLHHPRRPQRRHAR